MRWLFDDCVLDVERRELRRAGAPVAVEPQVFDLLVHLIRNRARVVSKDDLLEAVWQGRIVSDSALANRINAARAAVGDSGEQPDPHSHAAEKGLSFRRQCRRGEAHSPVPRSPAWLRRKLALPDQPSLVVLPFTDISPDQHEEPLRRWNYRGPDHRAGAHSMAVRDRAQFRVRLQEPTRRRETDLARARRALRPGGQRPPLGAAHADQCAARRRDDRRAPMGRALRQRRRRDIRGPGRDYQQRGGGGRTASAGRRRQPRRVPLAGRSQRLGARCSRPKPALAAHESPTTTVPLRA